MDLRIVAFNLIARDATLRTLLANYARRLEEDGAAEDRTASCFVSLRWTVDEHSASPAGSELLTLQVHAARDDSCSLAQLDLVMVISYVTLFTVVGSLMLAETLREFWSTRRGRVRPKRRAGEHAAYLGWPLRMRFHRSKLYASVIPIAGIALLIG